MLRVNELKLPLGHPPDVDMNEDIPHEHEDEHAPLGAAGGAP